MKKIAATVFGSALALMSAVAYAEDMGYRSHIKPIIDAKCSGCHGAGAPELPEFKKDKKKHIEMMKGPKMDAYLHLIGFIGWPDTGAVMRRLDDGKNTKDGKPGNMYQYLGHTEEEKQQNLKLFKDWVGNWTLKRWKDITKEELDGIKVKY
jgi:cytochrome c5